MHTTSACVYNCSRTAPTMAKRWLCCAGYVLVFCSLSVSIQLFALRRPSFCSFTNNWNCQIFHHKYRFFYSSSSSFLLLLLTLCLFRSLSFVLTPQLNSEYWIRFWMNAIAPLKRNAEKTNISNKEKNWFGKFIINFRCHFPIFFTLSLHSCAITSFSSAFVHSFGWMIPSFVWLTWNCVYTRAYPHANVRSANELCATEHNAEFIGVDFFLLLSLHGRQYWN